MRKNRSSRDVLQNENCNFRKGPGTRCEKNGACWRISIRKFVWTAFFANKFFVSRSDFVRWIQWFSWFRTVVRLVLSVQLELPAFFFTIEIWTSVMFSWSTFGLWWVACRMAFWTWCSSRPPSIQFELAMDLILRLRVGRAAHQLFFVDVTVLMREQSEKREVRKSSITTEQETTKNSWPQTVQTTRLGCRTDWSELHTQPATRANDRINSPIEQKLQFSVCRTTRRFAGPSLLSCGLKPTFTKICIRISFCKTSLVSPLYVVEKPQ